MILLKKGIMIEKKKLTVPQFSISVNKSTLVELSVVAFTAV